MSGAFREGAPISGVQKSEGIRSVAGTVGRKADGPDRIYGTKRQNIDQAFDDFSLSVAGGGGGGGVVRHPYQVTPDGMGAAAILSTTASYLHKSRVAANSQAITNLNTAFTLAADTHAWVEILVNSSLVITAAELKTGTAFPVLVVTAGSPAAQTKYNLPVGRVVSGFQAGMPGFDFTLGTPPSTTEHHWQQLLREHQLMLEECFSGTPSMVAHPWQGI